MQYIHPLAGNEPAQGFDLASNELRKQALTDSRLIKNVTVSEPITLMQGDGNEKGVLFFNPVYSDINHQVGFRGYVVAVVNLEVLAQTLNFNQNTEIDASFYDVTDGSNPVEIYNPQRVGTTAIASFNFIIGERVWPGEIMGVSRAIVLVALLACTNSRYAVCLVIDHLFDFSNRY